MLLTPFALALLPALAGDPTAPADRPRLVVVASLGPISTEHLERLAPWLEGGLARFLDAGRIYPAAELDYAITDDAPGAATIGTGCFPRAHGIVAESFLDRAAGALCFATHDANVQLLAPGGLLTEPTPGGFSPAHLLVDGLADRMRVAFAGARAVSIGGDPRPTVLVAGRRPDWALWWDRRAGGFTSSSWYGGALPAWVLAWNAGWAERAAGFEWAPLVAGDLRRAGLAPDERAGESEGASGAKLPVLFPSAASAPLELQSLALLVHASPLVDRFSIDLALEAVRELELGADDAPDLLCVALSACDVIAHRHGPDAFETADALLRADRELGRLFDALDERVGRDAWLAVLAGTSGMLDLPEALRERGVGARRIYSSDTRRSLAQVRERLQARYGSFFGAALPAAVLALDAGELARAEVDPLEVRQAARDALVESGGWVAGAYTLEELAGVDGDAQDPWLALYRRSFHPERAPDVAIRVQPWTLVNSRTGSDHGSPYPYDRRILLGWLGAGVESGRSYERAGAQDVLPTILALLGAPPIEGIDGRALRVGGE